MCREYNGYSNYETWNINLWLSNDEDTYHMIEDMIDDPYSSDAVYELSRGIKEYVEDNNPLGDDASMYADLLRAAISLCNFYEIAEHWIKDYRADNPQIGAKNNPAEYKIEPELPGEAQDNTWCAYDSEGDEIDLFVEDSVNFWDAFDNCIQHAIDNNYISVVIEWSITNTDVCWWNDFKADRLIAKQASRSTRKDA